MITLLQHQKYNNSLKMVIRYFFNEKSRFKINHLITSKIRGKFRSGSATNQKYSCPSRRSISRNRFGLYSCDDNSTISTILDSNGWEVQMMLQGCCRSLLNLSTMKFITVVFLIALAFSQNLTTGKSTIPADQIHPAIIIGAGIAGIASSKQLTSRNIPHLILEARNRIGGRIVSDTLEGVQVDLGATFVHNPYMQNAMDAMVKEMGWPTAPAKLYLIEEFFKSGKELTADENTQSKNLFKEFQTYIEGYVLMLNHNTDLLTGWLSFYNTKKSLYSERILERVYFELMMEALTSGADLREVSAKEYLNNREKGSSDYIPKGGYFALLKAIFDRYCGKATVKYETVVTEVDYSTPIVKVKTSKGEVYYAKRVISSLPLGVLKAGDVKFTPPLPAGHQEAIQKIGNGVFNKVIVSFTDYFWTKGVKVLDFIPLYSEQDTSKKFLQAYVVSEQNPNIAMFFTGGSAARELSNQPDSAIANELVQHIKTYINPKFTNFALKSYKVTRWQQDPYSKGSYSFYAVDTRRSHFRTLATPIEDRLYFVGEHTDHKQSSNAHGAFKAGSEGGAKVSASLNESYPRTLGLLFIMLAMLILY